MCFGTLQRKFCDFGVNADSAWEAEVAKAAVDVQELLVNLVKACPFWVHERNGAPTDAKALDAKLHAMGMARKREVDVGMDHLGIKMARVVAHEKLEALASFGECFFEFAALSEHRAAPVFDSKQPKAW